MVSSGCLVGGAMAGYLVWCNKQITGLGARIAADGVTGSQRYVRQTNFGDDVVEARDLCCAEKYSTVTIVTPGVGARGSDGKRLHYWGNTQTLFSSDSHLSTANRDRCLYN